MKTGGLPRVSGLQPCEPYHVEKPGVNKLTLGEVQPKASRADTTTKFTTDRSLRPRFPYFAFSIARRQAAAAAARSASPCASETKAASNWDAARKTPPSSIAWK